MHIESLQRTLKARRQPKPALTGESDADCHPALCALGAEPHAHCVCGLPMPAGASLCDRCRLEGFQPRPLKPADYAEEWDGRRYPSLRRQRPVGIPAARYDDLLRAILGPIRGRNAEHSTTEEAA